MLRFTTIVLVAALCLTLPVRADDEVEPKTVTPKTMTIGDVAPDIDITHWVKGVEMDRRGAFTPITSFGDGKVYVLEFWATWCGPCIGGMPHLSELQAAYRDRGVTIIGISDETLPKVTEFLFKEDRNDGKIHNDRTDYILTTDPDASVKQDYFRAAGQTGIPCAFIVGKDGHVEWIGHPIRMDEALEAVVTDTWDRDAFKEVFVEEQAFKALMRVAQPRLRAAAQDGDWPAYVAVLDGLLEQRPGDPRLLWQKCSVLIKQGNDPDAGYAMGSELLEAFWDDAAMLNQIAWTVVDDAAVVRRDLAFALKAAERANELAESADAAILDTLARVLHDQGDLLKAIEWQRKAVEHADEGAMGASIREVLERYEEEAAAMAAESSEPAGEGETTED